MLSVLLAAMMCASMLALCVSAGVNGTENTSVEIDAIDAAPVMDGVITTEEWGEPVAHVLVGMARKNYAYDDNNNIAVSDYCYMNTGGLKYINPLNFDLFLRWDADNLYVGVVAQDPYGYSVEKNKVDINGKPVNQYNKYKDGDTLYDILYFDLPYNPGVNVNNNITPHYNKNGVDTVGTMSNATVVYTDPNGDEVVGGMTGMTMMYDKDGKLIQIGDLWNGDAIQFGINNSAQGVNAGGTNNPFHNLDDSCGDTYIFNLDPYGVPQIVSDNRGYLGQVNGAVVWHDELYVGGSDWKKCGKAGGVDNDVPGYLVFEFAMPAEWYAATGKNVSGETIGLTVARVSGTTSEETELRGTAKDFPRGINASGDFNFVEGSTTILQAGSLCERYGGGYDAWISWGDGVMGSQADQVPAFRSGANAVTFVGEPSDPEPDVIRGDVNDDGEVNSTDAIYLLRNILVGEVSYPINQSGDMNNDGNVDSADAIYLLRHVLVSADLYPLV